MPSGANGLFSPTAQYVFQPLKECWMVVLNCDTSEVIGTYPTPCPPKSCCRVSRKLEQRISPSMKESPKTATLTGLRLDPVTPLKNSPSTSFFSLSSST